MFSDSDPITYDAPPCLCAAGRRGLVLNYAPNSRECWVFCINCGLMGGVAQGDHDKDTIEAAVAAWTITLCAEQLRRADQRHARLA